MERVVCLVSGGIDSPVACALAARAFEVVPVYFVLYPYTCEDTFHIAIDALRGLRSRVGFDHAVLFPWSRILQKILKKTGRYACVMCRRGMLRAADLLCERENAGGIITGESLGQKASQTLHNLRAVSHGIKHPILRPLLTMDKVEVERISKELGLWREDHAGCCYATPRHPKTAVRPETVEQIERELDLDEMVKSELDRTQVIRTGEENLKCFMEVLTT